MGAVCVPFVSATALKGAFKGAKALNAIKRVDRLGDTVKTGKRLAKGKRIIIGETTERVAKRARELGADYYKVRKLPEQIGLKKTLRNNYQWLRRKVKQGYEIIDIGFDRGRKGRRGIFYKAEKEWLKLWGRK